MNIREESKARMLSASFKDEKQKHDFCNKIRDMKLFTALQNFTDEECIDWFASSFDEEAYEVITWKNNEGGSYAKI